MAKTLRVTEMMSSFMEYRENGYSIKEISKETGVSIGSIYSCLEEIAKMNNVTRDTLLYEPHSTYYRMIEGVSKERRNIEKVSNLLKSLKDKVDELEKLSTSI